MTRKRMTVLEIQKFLRKNQPPGLSRTSIYEWLRKADLQPDKKHRFDLEQFLEAYDQRKKLDEDVQCNMTHEDWQLFGIDPDEVARGYQEVLEQFKATNKTTPNSSAQQRHDRRK